MCSLKDLISDLASQSVEKSDAAARWVAMASPKPPAEGALGSFFFFLGKTVHYFVWFYQGVLSGMQANEVSSCRNRANIVFRVE